MVQNWARAVSTTLVSIYYLTLVSLMNSLPAASDNVDIAKTTVSQSVDAADDKITPVAPQDSSTNDSATTLNPPSFDATGDSVSIDKSAAMVVEGAAEITKMTVNNMQVLRDNDTNIGKMSAPQDPQNTTMETPAPVWLRRMLVYLRGISDSMEWQGLVSALLKFENMNPPSGVRPHT